MATVNTSSLMSVTEANRIGLSSLVQQVERGQDRILLRNNKAVAAVVSIDRLDELEARENNLIDIAIAMARMLTSAGERVTLDDVLRNHGYSAEQLRSDPEYAAVTQQLRGVAASHA